MEFGSIFNSPNGVLKLAFDPESLDSNFDPESLESEDESSNRVAFDPEPESSKPIDSDSEIPFIPSSRLNETVNTGRTHYYILDEKYDEVAVPISINGETAYFHKQHRGFGRIPFFRKTMDDFCYIVGLEAFGIKIPNLRRQYVDSLSVVHPFITNTSGVFILDVEQNCANFDIIVIEYSKPEKTPQSLTELCIFFNDKFGTNISSILINPLQEAWLRLQSCEILSLNNKALKLDLFRPTIIHLDNFLRVVHFVTNIKTTDPLNVQPIAEFPNRKRKYDGDAK